MQDSLETKEWTGWQTFPDPRQCAILHAPFGPGVYELRHRKTGELVLIGIGQNCSIRMCSLLPPPLGAGTRNNSAKRDYVLENLPDIEYRCLACATRNAAAAIEKQMLIKYQYRFPT